ncbi:MAG: 50S ribosomal protein L18 [Planctomycetes bacterium]|nr:50S ribosomal protein L18 [Planctomycetota bacterium]
MSFRKVLNARRQRRQYRVRNKLRSHAVRPRLAIFRSHKHISCQLIDDEKGLTLVSASTLDANLRDQIAYGGNRAAAAIVGKAISERAKAAGIEEVCFDRGHFRYHGRIAALADAAREGGLKF